MTTKQKFLGLAVLVILVGVLVSGTSSVLAQTGGGTTPTPIPQGMQEGYGWNMHGMMWGNGQNNTLWTAVADALSIDVNTFITQMQSGSTLAQIAEAQGVDIQTVYDAAFAVMTDHMNAMVAAGYMTQTQVEARLTWMRDNMAQMPMLTGSGSTPCPMGGMMGGYGSNMMGHGMMGQGMMGGWNEMHDGMMGQHHSG